MQQHDQQQPRKRRRRFSAAEIAEMRALHALGLAQKAIAIRFRCTASAVSLIVRNKRHAQPDA